MFQSGHASTKYSFQVTKHLRNWIIWTCFLHLQQHIRYQTYPEEAALHCICNWRNTSYEKWLQAGLMVIILLVVPLALRFQHLPGEGWWWGSDKVTDRGCRELRGKWLRRRAAVNLPVCNQRSCGTEFKAERDKLPPRVLPPLSSSSHFL